MSTQPRAVKYRTRKVSPEAMEPADAGEMPFAPAPEDDGFGTLNLTKQPVQLSAEDKAELAAIRAEGFSARQLRLARRVATRNGISAATDHEAVMLLRRKGIDP